MTEKKVDKERLQSVVNDVHASIQNLFEGDTSVDNVRLEKQILLTMLLPEDYMSAVLKYKEIADLPVVPLESKVFVQENARAYSRLVEAKKYFNSLSGNLISVQEIKVLKSLDSNMGNEGWGAIKKQVDDIVARLNGTGRTPESIKLVTRINQYVKDIKAFQDGVLKRSKYMADQIRSYGNSILIICGNNHVEQMKGFIEKSNKNIKVEVVAPFDVSKALALSPDDNAMTTPEGGIDLTPRAYGCTDENRFRE